MRQRLSVTVMLASLVSAPLQAQDVQIRGATFFESYSFDEGLGFDRVSEISIPIGVNVALGRYGSIALSSGYASVSVVPTDDAAEDVVISGTLDTEVRLSIDLIPGRLVALFTGTVPTGVTSLEQDQLPVLGVIASDLVGFSSATLGAGGNVGGGFVGAVPVGKMALGFGATFRRPMTYEPFDGQTTEVRPGAEVRVRGGLEGPLGRRTYLRVAGVFARRGNDVVDGIDQNGVGNRIIGYIALNQGVGATSVTAYIYDIYRGNPQIEETAAGAALLPKGNLFVGGARVDIGVGARTTLTPRAEYRLSNAAPFDNPDGSLEKLGTTARFGLDLRHRVSPVFAFVVQGGGLVGTLNQATTDFGISGYRAALHLEITP